MDPCTSHCQLSDFCIPLHTWIQGKVHPLVHPSLVDLMCIDDNDRSWKQGSAACLAVHLPNAGEAVVKVVAALRANVDVVQIKGGPVSTAHTE